MVSFSLGPAGSFLGAGHDPIPPDAVFRPAVAARNEAMIAAELTPAEFPDIRIPDISPHGRTERSDLAIDGRLRPEGGPWQDAELVDDALEKNDLWIPLQNEPAKILDEMRIDEHVVIIQDHDVSRLDVLDFGQGAVCSVLSITGPASVMAMKDMEKIIARLVFDGFHTFSQHPWPGRVDSGHEGNRFHGFSHGSFFLSSS
jgi:hypothetical protein